MKYEAKLIDDKFIIVDKTIDKVVFSVELDKEVEGSIKLETETEVYEGPIELLLK